MTSSVRAAAAEVHAYDQPAGCRDSRRLTVKGSMFAVLLTCFGCGYGSPTAPEQVLMGPRVSSDYVTLSGRVYEMETPTTGEPLIADVVIEVTDTEGSVARDRTAEDGSYRVVVNPGPVSVRLSKEGYEPKASHLVISSDIVLNFSLSPI
jgi:hypothetical protein